jgi:hypothetical protein
MIMQHEFAEWIVQMKIIRYQSRISSALWLLPLFLLVMIPASAQTRPMPAAPTAGNFPTLAALEETVVPARDRVDLARRLRGVGEVPPPPESAPVRQVGEQETFWALDSDDNRSFQFDATLRVAGEHIYMWVENGARVEDATLQKLADTFDRRIYQPVRDLWGSEASPGVDGDPRVYGVFVGNVGNSSAAYFAGDHIHPAEVVPNSNEHEMFFYNLNTVSRYIDSPAMEATTAHEFQHMIRVNIDPNEDTWLNEGFSEFTMRYLGYDTAVGETLTFLSAPQTQLNTWSEEWPRSANYGAAYLFVTYFYERYGVEGIRALSEQQANGLAAVDNVLASQGEETADTVFADWVLANYLLDPQLEDGRYGYELLPEGMPSATPLAVVISLPYNTTGTSNQYATDYYVFTNVRDAGSLDVTLDVPDTVQLIPTTAYSGQSMWYSNRGDDSDMTLTRRFDLSAVESATFNYKTWYHMEALWDYAYVMASTDDGATWDILETEHTTSENPNLTSYGPGYTGRTDGWVDETIVLDDYAGGEVLLRFELINDDAVNQPGIAVDDASIPEIDYFDDFEADGGGWDASGWIHTDNRLPQQVWVQAIQRIGREVEVTRWLAPQESEWALPLDSRTDQVILAVSPVAPVTTVPVAYTLQVTAN